MSSDAKLGEFLREVSNWDWVRFVEAEQADEYTTNEAIIFALIRACAMEELGAIKLSLNRLDGKLKTPIKIEYPRVFILFPYATLPEGEKQEYLEPLINAEDDEPEVLEGDVLEQNIEVVEPEDIDLSEMSLRDTINKMSGYPRNLPKAIVHTALQAEQWLKGQGERPPEIPRVKSVLAAHILAMAQKRDIAAITEVFDQLDGKLVETLQILGDDLYITNYAQLAPPEARPNEHGVLQVEATKAQDMWAQKLGREQV
jgi:hypothetical protein